MTVAGALSCMRTDAELLMVDTCVIGVPAAPTGPEPTTTYDYSATAISCGFDASASDEAQDGSQVSVIDGVFRLPLATTITSKNRIKLTHRCGTALATPEYYSVSGDPRRGRTAFVAAVSRIVGNAAR